MATLTCQRCGATRDTHEYDVQQVPGPDRCWMVYQSPGPFPLDRGDPNNHVSGPCNGPLTRSGS